MAALCPGVKYGLSSQQNFGENKDVIFVKLTDSALRAIYDYIKNKNKFSCQGPTIQFLGNETGQLSFPSVQNGGTSFNFSVSSTSDMEGPGGSFECVQQSGSPRGSLEVLGTIPYKVRVLANEDVYATTRHRMTIAEENHKNKCTREIKPNEKDIGRKVKLKQNGRDPPSSAGGNNRPPSLLSANGLTNGRDLNSLSPIPNSAKVSNYHQGPINNSTKQASTGAATVPLSTISPSSNGLSNGLGSNHVSSSQRSQLSKTSVPDLAKRPLKERLIHLLAMRPLKKVELYDRLTKEGLRERSSIASVLKQISFMKDNVYHLNRVLWNDVREDWPYYTESERQMLKRRKPQNLTPPGSSDGGSSGSGQSPTSTHPESPPPPITSSSKRPGYYDNQDGLPTKRQRISHFRKPTSSPSSQNGGGGGGGGIEKPSPPLLPAAQSPAINTSSYYHNSNQRRPITDSRDASNMNPRSRESPTMMNGCTNGDSGGNSDLVDGGTITPTNNANNNITRNNNKRATCDSLNSVIREKTFCTSSNGRENSDSSRLSPPASHNPYKHQQQQLLDHTLPHKMNKLNDVERNGSIVTNGCNGSSSNRIKDRKYEKVTSSSQQQQRLATRVSPDSQSDALIDNGGSRGGGRLSPKNNNQFDTNDSEFPDYLTEFTTIRDNEQRRRYKTHFNADYAEYKDLHGIVEKVSRRFADLEAKLKKEDSSSPKYKYIKKQIYKEYNENKQDEVHQKAKRRFQYLHDKLSHIKRLVLEYDQRTTVDTKY